MSIKIRFHGDKAIIRWKNPMEKQFLEHQMVMFRDAMQRTAKISVKNDKGDEIPSPVRPKPQIVDNSGNGVPVIMDSGASIQNNPPIIKATSVIPSEFHISSGEAIPRILENPTVVKLDEAKQ